MKEPETTPPNPVKWETAKDFTLSEWIDVFGTTQPLPSHAARITAPVEGRVVSVLQGPRGTRVVEGQPVKKGDVIVQLDASLVQANRDKLKAGLKKLNDQEEQARVGVDLARIEVTRLNKLKTDGVTVAESDIQKAELLLREAELKLQGVKTEREAGQADLAAADVQLDLYTLKAPIDGRLGRILVVPGQTLPPGTLVAEVADLDKQIDVLCFVPPRVAQRLRETEEESARARKGQGKEARARILAVGEKQLGKATPVNGTVEYIADQAEVDTGNFAVKVRFPNTKLGVRGNTTVQLRIRTTEEKPCQFTLPESALLEDRDPPEVVVVEKIEEKKDKKGNVIEVKGKPVEVGTARRLRVKLGVRDRDKEAVEILSLEDPEKKWHGTLDDKTLFVVKRGLGLRTDDPVQQEAEEDEE
jgi:RND family efflux transporter MFP subunit